MFKHIITIIVLVFGVIAGETLPEITHLICTKLSTISFEGKKYTCSDGYEITIKIFYTIAFGLLVLGILFILENFKTVQGDYFRSMLDELQIHRHYENKISRYDCKKFEDRNELERLLRIIKESFTSKAKTQDIGISILAGRVDSSKPDNPIVMREVYGITRCNLCEKPANPVSFELGEGFAGNSWAYNQVRLGQRKHFFFWKNKAYKTFRSQDSRLLNSFFCIPLSKHSTGVVFSIVSIDSVKSKTFGKLVSLHKSHRALAGCIADILAPYVISQFSPDEDTMKKLEQAGHIDV